MTPYQKRVAATQATKDAIFGKPFKPGRHDCALMTKAHAQRMGAPIKEAAKAGKYHSIAGGVRWLKKLGYDSLAELLDAHFDRIPPASALPGDIVSIPGEGEPGALFIALGSGRILGWHQDSTVAVVMQPNEYFAAWRISPR